MPFGPRGAMIGDGCSSSGHLEPDPNSERSVVGGPRLDFVERYAAMRKMAREIRMTAGEWHEHATKCRLVAMTIEDRVARDILLEAADDYLVMARREVAVGGLNLPAYRAAAAANVASDFRHKY
jgi:hypothetical protein